MDIITLGFGLSSCSLCGSEELASGVVMRNHFGNAPDCGRFDKSCSTSRTVQLDKKSEWVNLQTIFRRLFALALDALFSFSDLPIKVCLYAGALGIVVFMLAGVWVLVGKALGTAPLGWSSLGLSLYFLGSIQLLFLGIMGEYVFRIYRENQNRPLYFVQQYYA